MKEGYYSERRAASREMRRLAARRKMTVISAVGCVLVSVVLAVFALIGIADANKNEDVCETIFEQCEVALDNYPCFGTIVAIQAPNREVGKTASYTEDELEMLALVIYQEAGGDACSDSTRRMVAEVALNRVDHPFYPNNLEAVLTQYGQYGMLYWTGLVWPQRAKYEVEQGAVNRAYRIAKEVLTSNERLLPGDVLFQAEFPQGKEIVVEQDGLYFCR